MEVNGPDISKYGVASPRDTLCEIAELIEKPDARLEPSNLARIGRYVRTLGIFNISRSQLPGSGGEMQLADGINTQAAAGAVEGVELNGICFDCSSVQGYVFQ